MSSTAEAAQFAGESAASAAQDRRNRSRQTYRILQWMAPCREGELPDPGSFRQVRCHDISCGGISYYCKEPPLEKFIVFFLRAGERGIYVQARVANCIHVVEGQQATFRIGCEFLTRLQLPSDGAEEPAPLA
jgi:PilZ domain